MKIEHLTLSLMITSLIVIPSGWTEAKEKPTSETGNPDMTPMADALKNKTGQDFEEHYLGLLILHHEDGIKMAQLALKKASRAELKQMMEKSAREQENDIKKVTSLLKRWNKSPSDFTRPTASEKMMHKSMSELQGLTAPLLMPNSRS